MDPVFIIGTSCTAFGKLSDRTFKDLAREAVREVLADAGLTIDAMRDLLPCIISPEPRFDPCENLRARLSGELEKLDRKLEDIGRSRDLIAGYIDSLGPTS